MTIEEASSAIFSAIECGEYIDNHEILVLAEKALNKQIETPVVVSSTSCGIRFGRCPGCGKETDKLHSPFYHSDKSCLQRLKWE